MASALLSKPVARSEETAALSGYRAQGRLSAIHHQSPFRRRRVVRYARKLLGRLRKGKLPDRGRPNYRRRYPSKSFLQADAESTATCPADKLDA
jgi:hypothetical protein